MPNTEVGRDVELAELVGEWGFQVVVLANGAWRDRPLPVEGADAWMDKGLVYQNPFIYWFNHYNEAATTASSSRSSMARPWWAAAWHRSTSSR